MLTEITDDLVITRVFDAPPELVYAAFTDTEHLKRWFGPHGFSIPRCESDPHPGGVISLDMRFDDGDGECYPMTGTYVELDPPHRLVTLTQAIGPTGAAEVEARNTFTFTNAGGKTAFTLRVHIVAVTELGRQYLQGMEIGWSQSLEKLVVALRT